LNSRSRSLPEHGIHVEKELSKLLFLLQSLLYPIPDSGADGNTYFDEEKHEQKRE
jgi:hypothetical protein